ncbi:MAG: TraB/GumN family protein [Saprospiraceae bacterium]|nr:TraB/GumN family protein [Saprospiraceae bacterium]
MRKSFFQFVILLTVGFLWTQCASTRTATAQSVQVIPAAEDSIPLAPSLLWEISGNHLQSPSFLFGTIHIIDQDKYFLPVQAQQAINQSKRMTFEINMEDMSDMSMMMSLITKAMMKDGIRLKDLLNETDYQEVEAYFNEKGLPLMMLERIKPMFLTAFASPEVEPGGLDEGSIKSYEFELFGIAQEKNMVVGGLETVDYQLSLFDSIPYAEQAKMLVQSIRMNNEGSDQFSEMMDMYLRQDIEAMHTLVTDDGEGVGNYETMLVENRNRNWIPVMDKMMHETPTFFAVGAGHLGGPNGVLRLLRRAGYQIKPLTKPMPATQKM